MNTSDNIFTTNGLLINGELVKTSSQLEVINPATGQIFARVDCARTAELNSAVAAAQVAAQHWAVVSVEVRQQQLNAIADCMLANQTELAELVTKEQGKPLAQAAMEVVYAEAFCRYFATQTIPYAVLEEDDSKRIEVHHKPIGVVAGIIPWNFPLLIAIYKLAPALLAGNSIILKTAPTTPVTLTRFGELIQAITPAGLVNILADNGELGPELTAHPDINKISFTGSTPTGKAIMASAAGTLKRITLELGGNDAAIVLDDAKPKDIAAGIFGSAFFNSGQVCIALKRLYVHEAIYDELASEIAALASAGIVGDGMLATTQFGPVQNKLQYQKVLSYLDDAHTNGTVIAGGQVIDGPGYFVPLTVVKDVTDGDRVVDEEPFGPILPIIKYTDLDDAIARANNSKFGLGGSVWSSDKARAQQVAAQLKCGTVWINQHCVFGPNIPFPASKESGCGVELGYEGLLAYTNLQVVNINKI